MSKNRRRIFRILSTKSTNFRIYVDLILIQRAIFHWDVGGHFYVAIFGEYIQCPIVPLKSQIWTRVLGWKRNLETPPAW